MPGDGIEPPTRGFSIDASKISLIISIVYISLYLVCQVVCNKRVSNRKHDSRLKTEGGRYIVFGECDIRGILL